MGIIGKFHFLKNHEICLKLQKNAEQYSADVLIRARWREPALDKSENRKKVNQNTQQAQQSNLTQKKKSRTTIIDAWSAASLPDDIDWSNLWDPELYVDNTIGDVRERISRSIKFNDQDEAFVIERRHVSAVFLENLELNDFPYDVQVTSTFNQLH